VQTFYNSYLTILYRGNKAGLYAGAGKGVIDPSECTVGDSGKLSQ